MRHFYLSLAMALLGTLAVPAIEQPVKTTVFAENEAGSRYYRIPAVAVTNDGTVVAVADKRGSSNADLPNVISVVCKYSTDNGETWSDMVTVAQGTSSTHTFGDPALAYDPESDTLLCLFSGDKGFWYGTNKDRCGFYVSKSTDGGKTWSEPRNINSQIYGSDWRGAFAASGTILRLTHGTDKGRIMFVANVNTSAANDTRYVKEYVCYSDDFGDTWSVANPDTPPAVDRGNESKLVELEDGTLLMSIRYPGTRMFSRSDDGGKTWSEPYSSGLISADCNGAIELYPSADGRSRLLHSYPKNSSQRINVSVSLSYDGGETWRYTKRIIQGSSAYSDLCVLADGTIGLFVEDGNDHTSSGYNLVFVRFGLDYITGGADDGGVTPGAVTGVCDDSPEEYFGLDGLRMSAEPTRGLFLKKSGAGVTKVLK